MRRFICSKCFIVFFICVTFIHFPVYPFTPSDTLIAKKKTSRSSNRKKKSKALSTKRKSSRKKAATRSQKSKSTISKRSKKSPREEIRKDTAIDKILISRFQVGEVDSKHKKSIYRYRKVLQKQIQQILNRKSYLESKISSRELPLRGDYKKYQSIARVNGTDGLLVGEFKEDFLRIALRTGASGRALASWTLPLPNPINSRSIEEMANDLGDEIIRKFPYRGFITFVNKRRVQLNLGKQQALSPGTRLQVFEFSGRRPHFHSPKRYIGEIEVTRISANKAAGRIVSRERRIYPYSKLAFQPREKFVGQDLRYRNYKDFWISTGGDFIFLDSKVTPDSDATLQKRLFQLTLANFYGLRFGFGGVSADISFGSGSNVNNDVSFLLSEATYELIRLTFDRWGFITSIGGALRLYNVTVKEGATAPLNTTSIMSPIIEQHIQYLISPRARLIGALQTRYPIISKDTENGSSKLVNSIGFGLKAGLRLDLSPHWAVENMLGTLYSVNSLSDEKKIEEIQFGINLKAIYIF